MGEKSQEVPSWLSVSEERIVAVLMDGGWLDVLVWKEDGKEDPDGASSFVASGDSFSFRSGEGEYVHGFIRAIGAVKTRD